MQIRAEQLNAVAQKSVPPIIALSSENVFLIQEAADIVRSAAREQGFLERQKFLADRSFDWQELTLSAQNLSLFGDRKLIELSIPTSKPGDKGSKALLNYLELAPQDTILLILLGKLDQASLRSKWYKALDSKAAVCRIWPVNSRDLPRWIEQRMEQKGLLADQDAVHVLAERVEGNLMAAAQEIDKLVLSFGNKRISADDILNATGDSARYNAFELVETCLQGKTDAALRMLYSLKAEGVDALAILWPLSNEIRTIKAVQLGMDSGAPLQPLFTKLRVWKNRQQAVQNCVRRTSPEQMQYLISLAVAVDQSAKGAANGNAWDGLSKLVVELSGRSVAI